MKSTLILALTTLTLVASAADKPKPTGPLKAFKGPEGEKVFMVEAEDGKKMYVHPKNVGGDWDGQTRLFDVSQNGEGSKDVYFMKKRGSKQVQYNVLVQRSGKWEFFNPTKTQELALSYSEADSAKMTVDDVLNAYKP